MLKDPDLAPEGRRKIDFAASRMPVLSAVAEELARTRPLAGHRIAACLHVTTETANLCRALVAGGAELALCASNPLSTKDDVVAAIHDELGAAVFAVHGANRETFYRQVATAPEPLPAGVHPVPAAVSERVARHKLAAIGVRCDDLTAAQQGYLQGWRLGT
jgi:adenosylhomocysteinase